MFRQIIDILAQKKYFKLHIISNEPRFTRLGKKTKTSEFGILLLRTCDTSYWESKMTQVWACIYKYAQTYTQALHFSSDGAGFLRGGVPLPSLVWPGRIRGRFQKSASSFRVMWISCRSVWGGSASNQQNATDADSHPSLKSLKQAASFLQPSATLGVRAWGWVWSAPRRRQRLWGEAGRKWCLVQSSSLSARVESRQGKYLKGAARAKASSYFCCGLIYRLLLLFFFFRLVDQSRWSFW